MSRISFAGMPASERELTLGREFRNIEVLTFEVNEQGVMTTRAILQSQVFALVGNPTQALSQFTEACTGGHA